MLGFIVLFVRVMLLESGKCRHEICIDCDVSCLILLSAVIVYQNSLGRLKTESVFNDSHPCQQTEVFF